MNTTLAGKILVFVNLVLSLAAAAWAIGIYTNHLDWPESGGVLGDRAQKRQAEIQERQRAAGLALARWQGATANLVAFESQLPRIQQWYAAHLKALEEGPGPVKDLVYRNGQLLLFQDGQPVAGLQPRAAMLKSLSDTEADILKQIDEYQKLLAEGERLTQEINGNKENKENPKGLRDLLAEEETAQVNARAELKYLEPFLYNRLAEAMLLENRKDALDRRVKELEGATKAALR